MKTPVPNGACHRMILTMMVMLSSLMLQVNAGFQPSLPRYDDNGFYKEKNRFLGSSSSSSSWQLYGIRRILTKKRRTRCPRLSPPHPYEPSPVVHSDCCSEDDLQEQHHQVSSLSSHIDLRQQRHRIKWQVDDCDDHPTLRPGRPRHSRWAKVSYTDAGTLQIVFPATGFDSSALMGSAFGVAWFAAVVPATFVSSIGTALFLVPFWVAGGLVAKSSMIDPLTATSVEIGDHAWNIRQTVAGRTVWQKWGATSELDRAEYYISLYRDQEPAQYDLILHGPNVKFGITKLSPAELQRLENTINEHLERINNHPLVHKSTNDEGSGTVINDNDNTEVLLSQCI